MFNKMLLALMFAFLAPTVDAQAPGTFTTFGTYHMRDQSTGQKGYHDDGTPMLEQRLEKVAVVSLSGTWPYTTLNIEVINIKYDDDGDPIKTTQYKGPVKRNSDWFVDWYMEGCVPCVGAWDSNGTVLPNYLGWCSHHKFWLAESTPNTLPWHSDLPFESGTLHR